MKIATWNVNSIKARLPNVIDWLKTASPDVVMLQELKTIADNFPYMEIEEAGYHCAVVGQKSYNGVAILSKEPMQIDLTRLPGEEEDEQARYVEAVIGGIRFASIYLPNGNPVPGEKFDYKLRWMDRLVARAKDLIASEEPFVLAGDYNVCPEDRDCYDPEAFRNDAQLRPESRAKYRELVYLGLTEAYRAKHPHKANAWTFWDYQRGSWQKDHGLRIDHFLLGPAIADRLISCDIDRDPRGKEKASDHTPLVAEIKD